VVADHRHGVSRTWFAASRSWAADSHVGVELRVLNETHTGRPFSGAVLDRQAVDRDHQLLDTQPTDLRQYL
jgi:hypothetical protein